MEEPREKTIGRIAQYFAWQLRDTIDFKNDPVLSFLYPSVNVNSILLQLQSDQSSAPEGGHAWENAYKDFQAEFTDRYAKAITEVQKGGGNSTSYKYTAEEIHKGIKDEPVLFAMFIDYNYMTNVLTLGGKTEITKYRILYKEFLKALGFNPPASTREMLSKTFEIGIIGAMGSRLEEMVAISEKVDAAAAELNPYVGEDGNPIEWSPKICAMFLKVAIYANDFADRVRKAFLDVRLPIEYVLNLTYQSAINKPTDLEDIRRALPSFNDATLKDYATYIPETITWPEEWRDKTEDAMKQFVEAIRHDMWCSLFVLHFIRLSPKVEASPPESSEEPTVESTLEETSKEETTGETHELHEYLMDPSIEPETDEGKSMVKDEVVEYYGKFESVLGFEPKKENLDGDYTDMIEEFVENYKMAEAIAKEKNLELPKVGGAKKKKKIKGKKKPKKGGAATSEVEKVDAERAKVNLEFGKKLFDIIGKLADDMIDLSENQDPKLVEYFSDASSKILTDQMDAIAITSRGYIPVLSGYYHTPEAAARTKRYLETLTKAAGKISESIAAYDISQSGKNVLDRIRSKIYQMSRLIVETNNTMDKIFARLAGKEIDRLVAGDSILRKGKDIGKIEPPSKEISGFTGDQHNKYMKALERLRSKIKRSAARHAILMDIDRFKKYMATGEEKMDRAIEKRLKELRRDYDHYLTHAEDATKRQKYERVIEFKLTSIKRFYELLKKIDKLLMESHKDFVLTAAVRENLYAALADIQVATSREGMVKEKLSSAVRELARKLIKEDLYITNDNDIKAISKSDLDEIQRLIISILSYSPMLKNFFRLANMLEATKSSQIDIEEVYNVITQFIVAGSIDYNKGGFIAKSRKDIGGEEKKGYQIQYIHEGETKYDLYIRHTWCNQTIEDRLFSMLIQAIAGRFFIKLDQHKADYFETRMKRPGAERFMLGGAIDDPIGISGSTEVIPEAAPLYTGLPLATRLYVKTFVWKNNKGETQEPQFIVQLPKSSRFRPLFLAVKEGRLEMELPSIGYSEAFTRKLLYVVNQIWQSFAGTVQDPRKRVSQIFDAFFDEINSAVMLETAFHHKQTKVDRDEEKLAEYVQTVGPTAIQKPEMLEYADPTYTQGAIKAEVYDALKDLAQSVFDILDKVDVSESQMVSDYKAFNERMIKRLSETEAPNRFKVLLHGLRNMDNMAGDMLALFMGFNEFVVTPMVLATGFIDEVLVKLMNLKMVAGGNDDIRYNTLHNVVIPGTKFITVNKVDGKPQIDANNLIAYLEDLAANVRAGMESFAKIGKPEVMEKYMTRLAQWEPKTLIDTCVKNVNAALKTSVKAFPTIITKNRYPCELFDSTSNTITYLNAGNDITELNKRFKSAKSIHMPMGTLDGKPVRITGNMPWNPTVMQHIESGDRTDDQIPSIIGRDPIGFVEAFNRLLVSAAHHLTISGEEPVMIYELATNVSSNSILSEFFQTNTITVTTPRPVGGQFKSLQLNLLPNTIATIKTGPGFTDNIFIDSNTLIPLPVPAPAAAGRLSSATVDAKDKYLFDVCIYPYVNSMNSKFRRRIDEVSRTDLAHYVAYLPLYINCFKQLLYELTWDAKKSDNETSYSKIIDIMKAFIHEYVKFYDSIREVYGQPIHMEYTKGDFDEYKTPAGNYDFNKFMTPMAVVQGIASIKKDGPVVMPSFVDAKDAMGLSWMTPALYTKYSGAVSLDAVPWTVDLGKRVEHLTGSNLPISLIVNNVARLGSLINFNHLFTSIRSGVGVYKTNIFHAHSPEILTYWILVEEPGDIDPAMIKNTTENIWKIENNKVKADDTNDLAKGRETALKALKETTHRLVD